MSRKTNNVAHEHAHLALRLEEERLWSEGWPSGVAALVEHDKSCIT